MDELGDLIKRGNEIFSRGLETGNGYYFKESIMIYEKIISINAGLPRVLTDLGTALLKINNLEDSLASYTKSLELKDNNPDKLRAITFYNRGLVNTIMEKHDLAIEDYKASINLNREDHRPHNAIGVIKNMTGDFIGAIEEYKKSLDVCRNEKTALKIKNNIKNSNKNMEIYLDAFTKKALEYSNKLENMN